MVGFTGRQTQAPSDHKVTSAWVAHRLSERGPQQEGRQQAYLIIQQGAPELAHVFRAVLETLPAQDQIHLWEMHAVERLALIGFSVDGK